MTHPMKQAGVWGAPNNVGSVRSDSRPIFALGRKSGVSSDTESEMTRPSNPFIVLVVCFIGWLIASLISTDFYIATGKGMPHLTIPLLFVWIIWSILGDSGGE